ncbi:MAG: MATE family efflux transporter [Thermoplasmata archaeon]
MRRMILEGPIVKTLLILGWPIMLTNLFQMLYNIADTYWLGKVSVEAVAAPTLAWPLVFLFVSLASGLGVAGIALVSQHTGAGNLAEVRKSAGQVMSILTLLSIAISALGVLGTDLILELMGVEADVAAGSSPYIKVVFAGMPFMFIIVIYSFILRGWGDTKTPMYITAFSVGLNMVLDPFLILGVGGIVPAYGVFGAGIATLVSRSIGGFVCLYLLFHSKRTLSISVSDLRIERDRAKQIFKIGLPSSIGQAMVALGFVILVAFAAKLGTEVLAAYGIGDRVVSLVFVITGGLTGAAVTMMGQSLGARKKDRAKRVLYRSMTLTTMFLLTSSVVFFLLRTQIITAFIENEQVIDEGGRFFAIFGFSIAFFGIFMSVQSAFQAAGHTVPVMVMGILRLWLMRIPLAFLFAFTLGFGADGVWAGMALSNLFGAIVAVAWASTGTWTRGVVSEPPGTKETGEPL